MIRKSGQRGVPVITVDDQVVVGFDQRRLETLLSQARPEAGPPRPSLGISIADASKIAIKAGAVPVFGALVGRVKPGSPGERAGFAEGDIITEANLRPVNSAADLEKVLNSLSPGSRLNLTVMRGNQRLNITALL